jgi:hypothetical protein
MCCSLLKYLKRSNTDSEIVQAMFGSSLLVFLTLFRHLTKIASSFYSLTTDASLKTSPSWSQKSKNPKKVFSKDLHTPVSAFDNLPSDQSYIFDENAPPADISDPTVNITSPAGSLPINKSYTYHWSQQMPYIVPAVSIKLIDATNFPISSDI